MGNKILKKIKQNKKGQGTLETVFVLIVMISLLMGITTIWLWANRQIVGRHTMYQATRLIAGQSSDFYLLPVWPVYLPTELREENVLLRVR